MGRHRLRHTTLTEDPTSEPDSVEQEFGNEYSEDTLNLLRGIERPPYLEETSSLDPVDDLDQYIEHGLSIPPATYDALQEIGQKDLENLEAAKDFKPDATAQDTIRYRQRLAQGASPQDMTWLKLRAYHRAMDELNADNNQGTAPTEADRMQAYQVPTDKVPADLLTMTPAQLAERQRLALIARSRAAKKVQKDRNAIQRILAMPDPSEESEWVAAQQQPNTMQQAALAGIMEAVREHQGSLQLLPPIQEREVPEEEKEEPEQQPAAAQVQPILQRPERRTLYTQTYLYQIEMQKKVQQQQRQRTAAFWLSFAAVSGAYILRHVRRALFKRKGPAKPPAKLQARPSDAGASGSGLRQRTSSGV